MSKYTTEVRYICQSYADDGDNVETCIEKSIPFIFTDLYVMDDKEHQKELEKKILRHYYTQEIGFETVGLWKLKLNTKLCEILPKYNIFYNNLKNVKDKLFDTADFTETGNGNNNSNGRSETTNNSNYSGTNEDTSHTSGTSIGKNDGTSTSDSSGNSTTSGKNNTNSSDNSTAWNEYNDTPQGSLDSIDNGSYLTNATKQRSNSSGSSTGTSDTTTNTTGKQNNTDTETTSSTSESTTTTNGKNKNESNSNTTTETGSQSKYDSFRHITGKNSGSCFFEEYTKLINEYQDIDLLVINELQPLFMGLWE